MNQLTAKPGGCEEASSLSAQFYIPCNRPAERMVKTADPRPYRMCGMCANHNVKNRGAEDQGPYVPSPEEEAGHAGLAASLKTVGTDSFTPIPSANAVLDEAVDYSAYAADAQPDLDSGDLLTRITRTVRELRVAREDVTQAEAALRACQERVRQIEEFTLPEMMREAGQTLLRTVDGETVELTETLHASIPAANLPGALSWLLEHGQAAIIKRKMELAFGKDEAEKADRALAIILEAGYTPKDTQSVHPQTLAAAIRELLAAGVDVPLELLGAHVRSIAKVKPAKK